MFKYPGTPLWCVFEQHRKWGTRTGFFSSTIAVWRQFMAYYDKKKIIVLLHIVNFQVPCVEKERECLYPQMIHLFYHNQCNDNNEAQRTVNGELSLHVLSLLFLFLFRTSPSMYYSPAKIRGVHHWSALRNRTFQPRGRSSCFLLFWLTV